MLTITLKNWLYILGVTGAIHRSSPPHKGQPNQPEFKRDGKGSTASKITKGKGPSAANAL